MAVFFSGPAEEVQVVAEESSDTATESDTKVDEASQNLTMLINGVTFWAYLQLSWLVLGRVSAVTHSVLNSLRRPVICTAGFLRFGGDPTALNITGIALAPKITFFSSSRKSRVFTLIIISLENTCLF